MDSHHFVLEVVFFQAFNRYFGAIELLIATSSWPPRQVSSVHLPVGTVNSGNHLTGWVNTAGEQQEWQLFGVCFDFTIVTKSRRNVNQGHKVIFKLTAVYSRNAFGDNNIAWQRGKNNCSKLPQKITTKQMFYFWRQNTCYALDLFYIHFTAYSNSFWFLILFWLSHQNQKWNK